MLKASVLILLYLWGTLQLRINLPSKRQISPFISQRKEKHKMFYYDDPTFQWRMPNYENEQWEEFINNWENEEGYFYPSDYISWQDEYSQNIFLRRKQYIENLYKYFSDQENEINWRIEEAQLMKRKNEMKAEESYNKVSKAKKIKATNSVLVQPKKFNFKLKQEKRLKKEKQKIEIQKKVKRLEKDLDKVKNEKKEIQKKLAYVNKKIAELEEKNNLGKRSAKSHN